MTHQHTCKVNLEKLMCQKRMMKQKTLYFVVKTQPHNPQKTDTLQQQPDKTGAIALCCVTNNIKLEHMLFNQNLR